MVASMPPPAPRGRALCPSVPLVCVLPSQSTVLRTVLAPVSAKRRSSPLLSSPGPSPGSSPPLLPWCCCTRAARMVPLCWARRARGGGPGAQQAAQHGPPPAAPLEWCWAGPALLCSAPRLEWLLARMAPGRALLWGWGTPEPWGAHPCQDVVRGTCVIPGAAALVRCAHPCQDGAVHRARAIRLGTW
jgi:hypothetical protein